MQSINRGYRGLSLLVELNLDRVLTAAALFAALTLGGLIVSA